MRFNSRLLTANPEWGDMMPGAEATRSTPNTVPAPQENEPWFHGRRGEIQFDPSRPAFFTRKKDGANWYAHERGDRAADPNVGEFRLRINKPARFRDLLAAVHESGSRQEDISAHSSYDGENAVD